MIGIHPKDKLLIVAPHPDDDSIGCGGLISLYPAQCDVLLVTDGYDERLNNLELSKTRFGEFENAMKIAGINHHWGLHIPEHQIEKHFSDFKSISLAPYTHLFVPNRYEYHIDHLAVYRTMRKLCRFQKWKGLFYEYEVWTTLLKPNFYLNIDSVLPQKRALIEIYKTQTANLDYVSMALGLNSYRGKTKGMAYAEAFYCQQEEKAAKYRAFKRSIKSIFT